MGKGERKGCGGALDTVSVLREFLLRKDEKSCDCKLVVLLLCYGAGCR